MTGILWLLALLCLWDVSHSYRVLQPGQLNPTDPYFRPYDRGFVGRYGDPSNLQRERVNEGAFETPAKELLYEGTNPRQACPGMVGPFSDGNYYCTGREFGYCDRRSGACFCNTGYVGMACDECHGSHMKVGTLCVPKTLCKDDCNGAGDCNFLIGKCTCQEHRAGQYCEIKLCTTFSPLCEACTPENCLRCAGGYYLTGDARVCSSCYDFDPRCAGCTKELGCTLCADPLLTSVRRSGYRASDPRLPLEEDTRELSMALPFGTKSAHAFAEAEHYLVTPGYSSTNRLSANAQKCIQGLSQDESWVCSSIAASHVVCGHYGVFKFSYPNYVIPENVPQLRLSVSRSGGGYGNVTVNYFISHISTNDSDLTATAIYTTSQKLVFDEGVVERSFLININDDNLVEANEVFQVVLEVPEGGGSVGPQFRTNVTILDDDAKIFSARFSYLVANTTYVRAKQPYNIIVQASDAQGNKMKLGGERIMCVVENEMSKWIDPGTPSGTQRHSLRRMISMIDLGDGQYKMQDTVGIKEQGSYQLRAWHAFPGGLKGQYYYDGFFENLALERMDRVVNFTWGYGKIAPHAIDYVSVRWTGALLAPDTANYYFKVEADDHARLWINGELLLDHWHEMYAKYEPSRVTSLVANQLYELVLEYRDVSGEAHCRLLWGKTNVPTEVVPSTNLFGLYELSTVSPTELRIQSGPSSPSQTECQGEGLFNAVSLLPASFMVCPRDVYGNLRDDDDEIFLAKELFKATLTLVSDLGYGGQGPEVIYPSLKYDHHLHCFAGEYTPQIAGSYRLDIVLQASVDATPNHVAGSPFSVTVAPGKAFGPWSVITNLNTPSLSIEAGKCTSFIITARDGARNLVRRGGDQFLVYTYQVAYASNTAQFYPTSVHNATKPNIRYGVITDNKNGTYYAQICPVLQGTHEIHVLLGGTGVSNQPWRILDKANSRMYSSALGTYQGQYVSNSPYRLDVSHSRAHGYTSTAEGNGLIHATVGVPQTIMITVRDVYDNVLITANHPPICTLLLDRTPSASVSVANLLNGSYTFTYTAMATGDNLITIRVDGMHIKGSPFTVNFESGRPKGMYSIAVGAGLTVGTVNVPSYFQVFAYDKSNNRRTSLGDVYTYEVTGANSLQGNLSPCPKPPIPNHPICDGYDLLLGHYWGTFTPVYKGTISVAVFLLSSSHQILTDVVGKEALLNSPWTSTIFPGQSVAANTDIDGNIYDTVAGDPNTLLIKLRDENRNLLISGGHMLEYVMYGVASEWGTIQPWGTTPGLPNAYHYKGFYSGDTDFYGLWVDNGDGTYTVTATPTIAGQYVSRYSIALPGLNATYFNDTSFGYLFDKNFNPLDPSLYVDRNDYQPFNLGTSISWTGDIGGRPEENDPTTLGGKGGLGKGSYFNMFKSRIENNVDFNLTTSHASRALGFLDETHTPFQRHEKFRESYWSARWVGMITPTAAENYHFKFIVDTASEVLLRIGGRGVATNGSFADPPQQVLNISQSLFNGATARQTTGWFNFTDKKPREIVIEYIHYEGDSFMTLLWESPSTPLQAVPASAFTHWTNISHFNTTVHPAILSPHHSTAWGDALTAGTVGHLHSFVVYARDQYSNLRQVGGDVPSMLAVGTDGAMFRGNVTDYGNSTYLIEYYATVAGEFHMYVTMGCCPAHPNIGIAGELEEFKHLLISGAPFKLNIRPDNIAPTKMVAIGEGVLGSTAGEFGSFEVMLRDLHSNPTRVSELNVAQQATITVDFLNIATGSVLNNDVVAEQTVADIQIQAMQLDQTRIMVRYNLTQAGEYLMNVYYTSDTTPSSVAIKTHILGSPFNVRVIPTTPDAKRIVCRGVGIRKGSTHNAFSFEVQLFDVYGNKVIHGGHKLYTRLIGDANMFERDKPVEPACVDTYNGRYRCSYQARYNGTHHLIIKLLNSSFNQPGGLGLTAHYYMGSTPGGLSGVTGVDSGNAQATWGQPYITRIEPVVRGSWPDGYIIPLFDTVPTDRTALLSMRKYNTTDLVEGTESNGYGQPSVGANLDAGALRALGQSAAWEGYVVPPRTDYYSFRLSMLRMQGSVYIDEMLVYDSALSISELVSFTENQAYHIRVEGVVTNATQWSAPVHIELQWSTPVVKWAHIPAFYLFDSAQEAQHSPYPVTVG